MRTILLVMALLMSVRSFSQNTYEVLKGDKSGYLVYKGVIDFRDLTFEDNFNPWMNDSKKYKPDTNAIKYLKPHIGNYNMVVFLGTWCSDSHEMIPKLYKVLQVTGYPQNKLMMYGVDREKTTQDKQELMYNLKNVPTVIVYKGSREIGRVVETVQKNIEWDLMGIIAKDVK